ncbi:hypothetical protein M5R23_18625 [Citrobacter freundii]|uniref:hypothetical protein n=1 Tax=Citrobacter freundii TaxID=546 RepID=UPI00209B4147|nr:hypothetical protein [Citrobacter freundii]MCO8023878.1 hypothetical protein [Citrobacter freundii]MCO8032854.1 hypothetical protein [Citrobacter freundii]MCO8036742.1 hypothetical protein [Citrobacter freundii]MCS0563589.1 hypothetical protein [Citrobacter freundii]
MNYQIFPLFFMRITALLFFLLAVGLSFIGISSLITYFVLIGIVFPVIVSMHLHRLNEAGTALTLTENTQWMVYIHGFPAQEQRSVLKNPCFFSQARLRQFLSMGLAASSACKLPVLPYWRMIMPMGEIRLRRCLCWLACSSSQVLAPELCIALPLINGNVKP